jgi:hypothetical protein
LEDSPSSPANFLKYQILLEWNMDLIPKISQ